MAPEVGLPTDLGSEAPQLSSDDGFCSLPSTTRPFNIQVSCCLNFSACPHLTLLLSTIVLYCNLPLRNYGMLSSRLPDLWLFLIFRPPRVIVLNNETLLKVAPIHSPQDLSSDRMGLLSTANSSHRRSCSLSRSTADDVD